MRLFFRQINPEKRKAQDIQTYLHLMKIKPRNSLDSAGERLLLETISPKQVRRQLVFLRSLTRKQLFSGEIPADDKQKRDFVNLTGEYLLLDSARSCRYDSQPQYMNHIEWTAKNHPNQDIRSKALAQLVLIARDMNSGLYPPQKSANSRDNDVLNIKNILHRSVGTYYSSEIKQFIDTPYGIPDFQKIVSGFGSLLKKASAALGSAAIMVMSCCDNIDIKKGILLLGVSGVIFAWGCFMKKISEVFLTESKLMESLIRKALKQQEWDKKVRA